MSKGDRTIESWEPAGFMAYESLKAEHARVLFFNRELVEENKQLKELNREMCELFEWIRVNCMMPEVVLNKIKNVLAKARGEGE